MRTWKAELKARVLSMSGLGVLLRAVQTWHGTLVLAYHRVSDNLEPLLDRELWSATSEAFDAQVRFLRKHFEVIGPGDLQSAIKRRWGRYVLLTFDDGYRDNYECAFPILRSYGVTAGFFVSTGYLDRPRLPWWDEIAWMVGTSSQRKVLIENWFPEPLIIDELRREHTVRALLQAYKTLPGNATTAYLDHLGDALGTGRPDSRHAVNLWMTWDMVREMKNAGMWIGGHTVNHPILARLNRDRQEDEIVTCIDRIRAELSGRVTCFSYPVGGTDSFNDDTRSCLNQCGIDYAFSYYGGYRTFDDWDPYDIRRIPVEIDTSLNLFRTTMTFPQFLAPWHCH